MKTFRRTLLDKELNKINFRGKILDIGGKKNNKRGSFSPSIDSSLIWHYINIDSSTKPDIICNASRLSIKENSYDCALICEVIEHLYEPEKALSEAFRILKPTGNLILTIPFLFPTHADPFDFQRWTEYKIYTSLINIGFSNINIKPMGGIGSVLHDLFFVAIAQNSGLLKKVFRKALFVNRFLFRLTDILFSKSDKAITTGYFVCCQKN